MENKITTMERGMQRRTELLLGKDNLEKIQKARVLIFGIGGVGSWCAEGLLRSGVRNITIVDSDRVCVTNCNRQLMATSRTIGVAIYTLNEDGETVTSAALAGIALILIVTGQSIINHFAKSRQA